MNDSTAVKALAALAHEDRLRAFRLLMRNVPAGLCAGDISRKLKIPPSSLTFHLGVLRGAGLVRSRRIQRSIVYSVAIDRTQAMLKFLMNDCCRGRPEVCRFDQGASRTRRGAGGRAATSV